MICGGTQSGGALGCGGRQEGGAVGCVSIYGEVSRECSAVNPLTEACFVHVS